VNALPVWPDQGMRDQPDERLRPFSTAAARPVEDGRKSPARPAGTFSILPQFLAQEGPHLRRDSEGALPRIIYAPHAMHEPFAVLCRLPRLLGTVQQLREDDAYVYQSRVNLKLPFAGDAWSWHQDFPLGTAATGCGGPMPSWWRCSCTTARLLMNRYLSPPAARATSWGNFGTGEQRAGLRHGARADRAAARAC
jgi:hypothetical protein